MPLAFSTLGCPGAPLGQVVALARSAGATGLELRAADGEIVYPGMGPEERAAVVRELSEAGLDVLALASYVRVCAADPEGEEGAVDAELAAAVDLAAGLGAVHVRVFPGAWLPPALGEGAGNGPGHGAADSAVPEDMRAADLRGARRLSAVAALARERGVVLALETHDSHPRAEDIARILAGVDPGTPVRVIWDLMHPWRHGEAPERTARLLAGSLAYAQYKDGVRIPGTHDVTPTLPGKGGLPLRRMQRLAAGIAAARGDVDPWVSLEWERAWHPGLPPLADALAALRSALA